MLPDRPPDEPEAEDPDEPDEPDEPRPPGLPPPLRFSNEFVVVSSMRSFSDNELTVVPTFVSRRDISWMRPSMLSGVTDDMLNSVTAEVRVSLMIETVWIARLCMRR